MTNELNDLVPAQEKLEWVTPKISLMVAEDTEGSKIQDNLEQHLSYGDKFTGPLSISLIGPS